MTYLDQATQHQNPADNQAEDKPAPAVIDKKAAAAALVDSATALRKKATLHYDRYEVRGRNAMRLLMAEIYAYYIGLLASGANAQVIPELKEKLKTDSKSLKVDVSDASVLVRFIFSSFTSKQIYQYGRTLEIMASKNVAPADFITTLEVEQGFEKLCSNNPVGGKIGPCPTSDSLALSVLQKADAEHVLPVTNWRINESARVYIGVIDGQSMLRLVDMKLSSEEVAKTLTRYRIETERAKKLGAKNKKKTLEIKSLQQAVNDRTKKQNEAHAHVLTAEAKHQSATSKGNEIDVARAEGELNVFKGIMKLAEVELEAANTALEAAKAVVS